ncbi:MAG: TOBE domain-containing protein, partial [Pseudomonadota bacterium]
PLPAPDGPGGPATLAIRPEKVKVVTTEEGLLSGRVVEASFLGGIVRYHVATDDGRRLLVEESHRGNDTIRPVGMPIGVTWQPGDGVLLETRP